MVGKSSFMGSWQAGISREPIFFKKLSIQKLTSIFRSRCCRAAIRTSRSSSGIVKPLKTLILEGEIRDFLWFKAIFSYFRIFNLCTNLKCTLYFEVKNLCVNMLNFSRKITKSSFRYDSLILPRIKVIVHKLRSELSFADQSLLKIYILILKLKLKCMISLFYK